MDIAIGSWKKTHHKSNRSGGSKYDPIVAFTGGLRGYTGGSPRIELSLDRFIPAGLAGVLNDIINQSINN